MPLPQTDATIPADGVPAIDPSLSWLIRGLIVSIVVAAAMVPLWIPVLLGLLALAVAGSELRTRHLGWPSDLSYAAPTAAVALFAWMLLGSLWALNPLSALTHPFIFLIDLGIVISLSSWFARLPKADQGPLIRSIIAGGVLAIPLLAVEILSGGVMTSRILAFVALFGDVVRTGVGVADDGRVVIAGAFFNRHVAAMVLILPSILLCCRMDVPSRWRRMAIAALVTSVAIIVSLSDSATAVLGFLGAAVVYPLARRFPRPVLLATMLLFAGNLICAPWLALAPDRLGLAHAQWLPASFRDRVGIWQWNADALAHHWRLGIGLHGTQILDDQWNMAHGNPSDLMGMPRPSRHPHNGFLEVWSELGIVGVGLTLTLGLAMLRAIPAFSIRSQPFLMGLAAAAMGIAATGWSLWQPWLVASFATAVLFLVWGSLADSKDRQDTGASIPLES